MHASGALPAKVKSKDIYLGSIPFVLLQLVVVAIVIFVPQTVTAFLDKEVAVDADSVVMPQAIPNDTFELPAIPEVLNMIPGPSTENGASTSGSTP